MSSCEKDVTLLTNKTFSKRPALPAVLLVHQKKKSLERNIRPALVWDKKDCVWTTIVEKLELKHTDVKQ